MIVIDINYHSQSGVVQSFAVCEGNNGPFLDHLTTGWQKKGGTDEVV
jgi:hypothetical protein